MTTAADLVGLDRLRAEVDRCPPDRLAMWAAGLAPRDLALVERIVAERTEGHWRSDPSTFAEHLTRHRPPRGRIRRWRYVALLGRKFREAVEGVSTRQIWLMPARYGKSTMASQWGPAWAIDRDPSYSIILASYGLSLSDENADAVREILTGHPEIDVRLRKDRRRRDRWKTTAGGGLLAASVGSKLTGFGGHGIVVDDPFKDWQEAHSAAARERVWNWYRAVVRLRLDESDSWIIVPMTRWHGEDLAGKLVAEAEADPLAEQWDVVRLPSLAEAADPTSADPMQRLPDPLGREPGEPLEPERFNLDAVNARIRALGTYLASGLEFQRPSPAEGKELLREWWTFSDQVPAAADDWLTSWDTKLKDTRRGDYTVGQVWARVGSKFWLLDSLRGQWPQAIARVAVALLAVRWPQAHRHLVETGGYGPELAAGLRRAAKGYTVSDDVAGELGMSREERAAVELLLRRGVPGVQTRAPKGDKVVRARAVSGIIEAGDVVLAPRHGPWIPSFMDECAEFPDGANDDQVDAMSQALAYWSTGGPATAVAPGQANGGPPVRVTTSGTGANAGAQLITPGGRRRIGR